MLPAGLRPHLFCCIARGLAMDPELYRRFIQLQTAIHEGPPAQTPPPVGGVPKFKKKFPNLKNPKFKKIPGAWK